MDYRKNNAVSTMRQLIQQSKFVGRKAIEFVTPIEKSKDEHRLFEDFLDRIFPHVKTITNTIGQDSKFHTIFEL